VKDCKIDVVVWHRKVINMNNKEFVDVLGMIITEHRKKHYPKLSSREFAEYCGLSKSVMNRIENHTHNGNLNISSLNKIAIGLGLNDHLELREVVKGYNYEHKSTPKNHKEIIISEGTKLYDLFDTIKDFNDESIEMLHNLAVKFKK